GQFDKFRLLYLFFRSCSSHGCACLLLRGIFAERPAKPPTSQVVNCCIRSYTRKPGIELGFIIHPRQCSPDLDKRFLSQVTSLLIITYHARQVRTDTSIVVLKQSIKG